MLTLSKTTRHLSFALVCIAVFVAALTLSGCTSTSPAPVERGRMPTQRTTIDSYIVKPGDTLYSIARELGIDHRDLISLNRIETPDSIAVGQVLKIKSSETSETAGASTSTTTAPVIASVVVIKPIGTEANAEKPTDGSNTASYKREPKAGKETYSDDALARAQNAGALKTAEAAAPAKPNEPEPVSASSAAASIDVGQWAWPSKGSIIAAYNEKGNKGLDFSGKAGDPIFAAANGKVVYSGSSLRGYGKLLILSHNDSYTSVYAHNRALLVSENQTVKQGQKIAEMGNTETDRIKLHFEIRKLGNPLDPQKFLPKR